MSVAPEESPSLHALGVQEYLTLNTDREWLIEPLIPAGGACAIAGEPKIGKSSLVMGQVLALANDEHWYHFATTPGAKVLYIQMDMPRSLYQNALRGYHEAGMVLPGPDRLRVLDREILPFPFDILRLDHAKILREECDRFRPTVVVFDTLRRLFLGDEDNSDMMSRVVSSAEVAVRPAAQIFVHHANKASGEFVVPTMNRFRGSTALTGAMDCLLFLESRAGKKQDGKKHATLTAIGRAIAESESHWIQDPALGYLWHPAHLTPPPVEVVWQDETLTTLGEKIARLAELEGISKEAARSKLRRYAKSRGGDS